MNLKSLLLTSFIFSYFLQIYCQYPEDFSSIEQLTYLDASSEEEEIYLGSYYHDQDPSSLNPTNDYHNGIKLYPKTFSASSTASCSLANSYDKNDDEPWNPENYENIYYPPTYYLANAPCIHDTKIVLKLDLTNFLSSEIIDLNAKFNLSYIFYFWIEKIDDGNNIQFYCNDPEDKRITFPPTSKGLYQFYLKSDNSGNFYANDDSFFCESKEIAIENSAGTQIYFHRLKLNLLIEKEKISSINCNSEVYSGQCPYSYYCDKNTSECKKCLGKFSQCQGRNIGKSCSPYSREWEQVGNPQQSCNADYFNLQYLGEMTYDINPPIKSNAASISFWLFTTEDIYELEPPNDPNPNIYHITLEDFFVVTIIPGKYEYVIYATAYEMYHKAYGTVLTDITTKQDFEKVMTSYFPYQNWYTTETIGKINRWVNIIVSYNKNLLRISLQISYKKRDDLDLTSSDGSSIIEKNEDLEGELIYNTSDSGKNRLHFKKFYRNSDTSHLNIKIYNNNIGVYFRNLYVFVTELLIPGSTGNLQGFQYIEFEKIFKVDNYLMPELILAVPFENIQPAAEVGKYFIEYYIYDMTKIYNNLNRKLLTINPGIIEDYLYTYSPGLYRLNLIKEKNKMFNSPILDTTDDITSCTNEYCYKGGKPYACRSGYVLEPSNRDCVQIQIDAINTHSRSKLLVPGINAQNNQKGTLTDICYEYDTCERVSTGNILTDFKCSTISENKIFDACLSEDPDFIGYFYYSYFFKLPPLKFNLNSGYDNYTVQFNFLYETNNALRPKNEMKGKKLYLFYSDGFRIWHDYSMNYLGIEDKQGNSYKNLLPNFNTQNENLFTITVRKENDIYKGKIFVNGVKIYMPPFTAGSISYILFCHNDTACPAGKNVFWTSGFYNQIKIYNLDEITMLNDFTFYGLYIYNNYYTYYNYGKNKQRFNSYLELKVDSFDMGISNIFYNEISSNSFTNFYDNKDKLQMFNYGVDQTSDFEEGTCANSNILNCYGETTIFSQEAKVCKNTYYKYDTCQSFPTSGKDKYYTLTLPLKEDLSKVSITYDLTNVIFDPGKATYTFWIKLLGLNNENDQNIFQFGEDVNACLLYFNKYIKLNLKCSDSSNDYYLASKEISNEYFGKYIHISIAISMHSCNTVKKNFISFQVNNEEIGSDTDDLNYLPSFININSLTLYTQIYAQIAKFYIYNEALIGGYAFNTNPNIAIEPAEKIVFDNDEKCLKDQDYTCIHDYDPVFNDDYYTNVNSGTNVFLTQNNMYKIKKCSDECATSCYGTSETQCACATNSFYDYIYHTGNLYQCKKLPYLNFKRYQLIQYAMSDVGAKGLDFWFFATEGVNDYPSNNLFEINLNGNVIITITIKSDAFSDNNGYCTCDCFNDNNIIIEHWCHVTCSFSSSISITRIEFVNSESASTSPGIMLIRQFKLWANEFTDHEDLFYTAFINSLEDSNIILSIDSLFNSNNFFDYKVHPSYTNIGFELNDDDLNEVTNFGYSPIDVIIPELELCLETEDCKDIINLSGIKDLEFKDIIPSGTGRYTMEFWLKIKNIKSFLNGINAIWRYHVSISAFTDTSKDKLSLYCFPQDYLVFLSGKKGRDILPLYIEALNKLNIDLDLTNKENTWIYMRCAYNWDNEIYYFESHVDGDIVVENGEFTKEKTYDNNEVDYPYKFLFNEDKPETRIAYIENAHQNKECEVYIRSFYLFNEYLPQNYNTTYILFTKKNTVRWLILAVDFFKYKDTEKKIESFKKDYGYYIPLDVPFENMNERKYISKGGIKLEEAVLETSTASDVFIKIKDSNNNPLECKDQYFLQIEEKTCASECPVGYNRGPGSLLDMDETFSGMCNYKLTHYTYQKPDDFNNNLVCSNDFVRVGFKCLERNGQNNSAIYFNSCYNFYPGYAYFTSISQHLKTGYILEVSFKIDLANDFCPKTGITERYLLYAHPHAIIQDPNNEKDFYYKDTNDLSKRSDQTLPLSLYEWNHVIIEFRADELKVNIYVNYNLLEPCYSYTINSADINNYILSFIAFCLGGELCEPLQGIDLTWGAAYYKEVVIYSLKYSSVHMVYERMRNKFNYESNSILVYYLLNSIGKDNNSFDDLYSNINFAFNTNFRLMSVYLTEDYPFMFSSSSNFDYGDVHPYYYVTDVKPLTGISVYKNCFDGCKRCYSSAQNDCYECREDFELYNKECRIRTGYYYQLTNINKEIKLNITSTWINNNPLTITLWVKYYGLIRKTSNTNYVNRFPSTSGVNCPMLIQFSTDDDIFLCHDQDSNSIFIYKGEQALFNDTAFLKELGKWQLLSISNYKCAFGNENTCKFYPSMFSFAVNGQTASRQGNINFNTILGTGLTINQINFGYGIIMLVGDINFYSTFILNPLGIVTNYQSYKNYIIHSYQLYSSSSNECLGSHILLDSTGKDMFYQQAGQCISDYNIYNNIAGLDCQSEDKMINITSLENECLDCIPECDHCGGETKLNCSCYYNDTYWFRNDKNTNRLYCQLVPYLDLNKYSTLEFTEIKYATTNEYAIEFWYFLYEYDEVDIHFYYQTISWENHVKIEFTKYSKNELKVECFPINERDESIFDTDVTQTKFRWNHIICATDLNKKLYYLNDRKVNNIIGQAINQIDYSTYENRSVSLKFESLNNMGETSSNGVFLIKELKLWNFFSVREFDTKCIYNYEWAKNNDVPNILHYFPFKMDKEGKIKDVKNNEPFQVGIKNNIKGYNIIDINNKYDIDEEFEECLIIYALPQRIYFNLTHVLVYNYEIEPKTYPYYNYKYESYVSKNAEVSYINITKSDLRISNNPRELLIPKFKSTDYNGVQLNIYVTLTEIDTEKVHYGFTIIKINSYHPGLDLDFKTEGLQDNLEVNINDLSSKYAFTNGEIWNRLNLTYSMGDIHPMALNSANTTTTFLNYYYDENTVSYYPKNIIVKNPVCNDNYCSGRGKCVIIVRNMVCKCDEGYTGSNCHLTKSNKEYLSETNLKLWNYLTNINEFTTLNVDNTLLEQITFLVKSSSMFDDSYNVLIQNYFNFIDYIKVNYYSLLIQKINLVFDTISYIIRNMYNNIQQYRAINYFAMGNSQYSTNTKIGQVDLTTEQIESIYDLSIKITTLIPELILYLVKENKVDTMQNYTGFDFTIISLSHSFDYLEYFDNLHINYRERYNTYLPFIDAYQCADYIFGSTGYTKIFLVLLNYHYDPLAYHPQYSSSASYSLDAFYATQIGEKLDIKSCPNFIDIYFPLTLFNQSEIEFINSHTNFLGENEENKNYDINDPYVSWPVYVNKEGVVSRKSRYDRINEVLPMINLECSYYNGKQGLASNITTTLVSDNFYLVCQTHHLSFYTMQSQSSKLDYKKAGKFFYLGAPQVFICGDNWGNGCSVLLFLLFFIFGSFIALFAFLEKTLMITKSSLNNIKLEILKQNRLIIDEEELVEEITKVNKMNEQDNMEKNLKIQTEHDKVDKDLKENLYLYGTKNIDYNDKAFEGGNKGKDLEQGYGGKGVFSNPPKKRKAKSKKKDKHDLNTGFIIDDLYDIEEDNDKEDNKSENEKETNIKKSMNYINKRKAKKKKFKPQTKTQDNEEDEDNKIKNMRYYHVKEYNPEKANEIDKFNYNMYKDSDFGFNESEGSEENKQQNNLRINSDIDSLRGSKDQLEEQKSNKSKKEQETKGENDENKNNVNTNMHDNDEDSDGVENVDYFSKYKSVIKNENRKGGKKVNVQHGNYTIVDKYRKVTFVKEKMHYINLPDFFEQINKKDPKLIVFFWHLFLRRVVYISPFTVSSTINPRWRRILCLYMYILLQFLFLTFEMTLAEDTITKAQKVFLFQLINICFSDLFMLLFISFFRISTNDKRMLFLNLKSTQQMQLLKAFKTVKETQKKKLKYIIGIMVATFIITFYFSFNYCVVLYDSRWTFAGCFLVGVVFDCFLYEGLLNGLIILFYYLKKKYKFFEDLYRYLFNFRNFRNCF